MAEELKALIEAIPDEISEGPPTWRKISLKPLKDVLASLITREQPDIGAVLERELAPLKGAVSGINTVVCELQADVEKLKKDMKELKKSIKDLKKELKGLTRHVESSIATLAERTENLENTIEALETKVAQLERA